MVGKARINGHIATFCIDYLDNIHPGLACGDIVNSSLAGADQGLWVFSIAKARECFTQLGGSNSSANRCLEVLDRIWSGVQNTPPMATDTTHVHAHVPTDTSRTTQTYPASTLAGPGTSIDPAAAVNHTAYAVDPALQIFLKDASWDNTIFEGLHGFLSTVETEPLFYDLGDSASGANDGQGWSMFGHLDLEPT
ncbi:hypothetical protein BJY01DRAFT_242824 [Aspergillus pseudoustus]|uniref:Uncharacterized protein n=1 Tax=Aspergillus pseudoustus TaxID=1810923 RepID=A0ABR4KW33_9EURO